MWKANRSTGHKSGTKKKSDSQKEIEPIPFRAPGRRSIHLATRTYGEQGHLTGLIHHKKMKQTPCLMKNIFKTL